MHCNFSSLEGDEVQYVLDFACRVEDLRAQREATYLAATGSDEIEPRKGSRRFESKGPW